ncbi:hypothetical protein NLG97_g10162 [Lecanicillium saksenae]|uniref:Uncharacterized protein n=1 Tax=Lecanicillium saksenae TaxID=468837 RepID=A0ACC1QDY2_9HYPO|nr:hypothetical protein NLG97_g10162 [Lecanicillium saksenae]
MYSRYLDVLAVDAAVASAALGVRLAVDSDRHDVAASRTNLAVGALGVGVGEGHVAKVGKGDGALVVVKVLDDPLGVGEAEVVGDVGELTLRRSWSPALTARSYL